MPDSSQVYHFISLLSCHKGFFPLSVHSVNGIDGPSPWERGTQNMGEKRNMPLQLGLEALLFDFKKVVDWKLPKKKKSFTLYRKSFYQIQQILSCFEVLFNMENVYCFFFSFLQNYHDKQSPMFGRIYLHFKNSRNDSNSSNIYSEEILLRNKWFWQDDKLSCERDL